MTLRRCGPLLLTAVAALLHSSTLAQTDVGRTEIPAQGAASLVFVFDVTGSMYDDLLQVIEGASKILATTLSRREQPLHDYVLVPFRDPDVGPVTVTSDPDEFEDQLSYLYVQGGGDCPEMSISAIRKALEVSLPRSYIYVFTDARAKDYHLTDKVIELIQRKESQVVFVMTGDCGDNEHEGFLAYTKIASTSSGQVFLLKKHQVDKVLNFVQIAINTRKVNLLAVDKEKPAKTIYYLPVDTHLREFTVSVSGEEPYISIVDDHGNPPPKDSFSELLRLKNVYIVNVKDPSPGNWTLDVSSSSAHTVRITGISKLDFIHRFGVGEIKTFTGAYARPVAGIPMYTFVNGSGMTDGVIFQHLEFISLDGQSIVSLPLHLSDHSTLYNSTYMLPPDGFFYLQVSGTDEMGYPFIRSSKSAISAVIPQRPQITTSENTLGHYNGSVTLICLVDSLIPFKVTWSKGDNPIVGEQHFLQTDSAKLTLSNLRLSDEGDYSCAAESDAGIGIGTTFLDVTDPPPTIRPSRNVTVGPGDTAILDCLVDSGVEYDIRWYRVSPRSGRYIPLPALMFLTNNSLMIQAVEEQAEGWYMCEAENVGGSTNSQVFLKVGAAPVAVITPREVDFVAGGRVRLQCDVQASPAAFVVWRRGGVEIRPSDYRITIDGGILDIRDMKRTDSGRYECVATNVAGSDIATALIRYKEKPVIRLDKMSLLVANGDSAALVCQATGIPAPKITWYKSNREVISTSAFMRVTASGELMILRAQPADSAVYTCRATNSAGEDQAQITLEVGSVPVIRDPPRSSQVDIGSELSLPCSATGYPTPTIMWSRDGQPLDGERVRVDNDNTLIISEVTVEDEGSYVCSARNNFGTDEASATVVITGISAPVIAFISPLYQLKEGETFSLQCNVIIGNPTPNVKWYRNGVQIERIPGKILLSNTGVLTITDVNVENEAEYMCKATNIGGSASMHTRLDVRVPPSIVGSSELEKVSSLQGDPVTLRCEYSGDPEPEITWSKNGSPISLSDPHYYINMDGNLDIFTTAQTDSGQFTCSAKNPVGDDRKTIALTVQVKPKIARPPVNKDFTVKVGDQLIIPCDVTAYPPPTITWTLNGQQMETVRPGYTLLSSGAYKLDKVTVEDAGVWTCIASNEVGNTSQSVSVRVNVPPEITDFGPQEYTVLSGDPVTLKCQAAGTPLPTVKWQRNNNFLTTEDFAQGLTILADGSLRLASALISDEGFYTCVASNDAGQSKKSIKLIVHDPPKWPETFTEPEDINVIQGYNTKLLCPAQGYPKPEIMWYKDGRLLTGNELGITLNEDGSLDLSASQVSDSGSYSCEAKNPAGDLKMTIKVSVHVPPKLKFGELLDPTRPGTLEFVLNSTITLQCPVDAVPPPTIRWYKKGQMLDIPSDNRMSLEDSGQTLIIQFADIDDEATYKCIAENVAGETEKSTNVVVLVPPGIDREEVEKNFTVVEGRNVVLRCPAYGTPPPNIVWFKNGHALESSDDVLILDGGKRLLLTGPGVDQSGEYMCVAESDIGITDLTFTITVYVLPKIPGSNEVATPEVIVDDSIDILCPATGLPSPKITWSRIEGNIEGDERFTISEDGRTLTLRGAELTDRGRFVCTAENKAGQTEKLYDLSVLIPPSIDLSSSTESEQVVQNHTAVLTCAADGDPYPDILWLRHNELIDPTGNFIDVSARGRQLRIHNAQVTDEGIYSCLVTNKAGELRHNVTLTVLIPPSIKISQDQLNRTVVAGLQVSLNCPARGKPMPTITWTKDGTELNIAANPYLGVEEGGRRLVIANTTVDHTATYGCKAVNPAGRAEIRIKLNVIVPPTILDSDVITALEVVVNDSITIECITDGVPEPSVYWLSNGQRMRTDATRNWRVTDGGTKLTLVKADLSHTRRYTCISENEAGRAEKDFDLEVLVPPYIDETNLDKDVRIIQGRQLYLSCPAVGTPYPDIKWMRNGFPIESDSERISLLASGRQLSLPAIKVDETGTYTCQARNIAGQDTVEFNVLVMLAPQIDISNKVPNQRARQNHTVIIECPAHGIPEPTIQFFKNGQPISDFPHIKLEDDNRKLVIESAQVTDSARYACVAKNEAGEARQLYNLQVQVPARIQKDGLDTDLSVIEKRSIIILCPVTGIPEPSIIWFKGRAPLFDWPYPNMRLMNRDQQLEISSAELSDAGTYSCKATNAAGRDKQEFHLQVYLPPEFEDEESSVTEQLQTVIRDSFSLSCPVTGEPKPEIRWYKDSQLVSRENPQYRLSFDGSILDIISVKVADAGRYTCEALNPAGTISKDFLLTVYVPSSISNWDTVDEISVTIGSLAALKCDADGLPTPYITWYRDGLVLDPRDSSNIMVRDSGKELNVLDSQLLDAGPYSCLAVNPAGNASKSFSLKVLVPPSIEHSDNYVTAAENTRLLLLCETQGLPEPDIIWYKNGEVITDSSLQYARYRILQSGSLEVVQVKLSDSGNFTCTAENEAGKDEKTLVLSVQVPPVHLTPYREISSKARSDVIIGCDVTGTPSPRVIWQIGTRIVANYPPDRKDKSLLIESASSQDSGMYICVAQNPAGTAIGRTKLQIIVAPQIDYGRRSYTVIESRELQLPCRSEGVPQPDITWYHQGVALDPNDYRYRVLHDGRLAIPITRSSDSGNYTCVAENSAGKDQYTVNVDVQVPAEITTTDRYVAAIQGYPALLDCAVRGTPTPTILWQKDYITISADGSKYGQYSNGSLLINNVKPDDGGTYICEAVNDAGQDTVEIALRVQVPPKIILISDPTTVSEGDRIYLECEATGNPVPSITWRLNNTAIPSPTSSTGRSRLVIENAMRSDIGTYACVAENAAGMTRIVVPVRVKTPPRIIVPPGNTAVRQADQVILDCSVGGSPAPDIIWTKNGRPVQLSNRIQQLSNGSLVIYNSVNEDGGEYKCVASNDAGTSEGVAYLTIRSPPHFIIQPVDEVTVKLGGNIIVDCDAFGEPIPSIDWKKERIGVMANEINDRISMLANHSLMIIAAQESDGGKYFCVASNELGSVLKDVIVKVQIDGDWSDWSDWDLCSKTCGHGTQTRLRSCDSPKPVNGGHPCSGEGTEVKSCVVQSCAVDGGWSDWLSWEPCSATCGQAEQARRRLCDNPIPENGGRDCVGESIEFDACNLTSCPVDGDWSRWSPWQPCSVTCGDGHQERYRYCNDPEPAFGGRTCHGADTDRRTCYTADCPIHGAWSGWEAWSTCSVSCGGGQRSRARSCSKPAPQFGGRDCIGAASQTDFCNSEVCPSKLEVNVNSYPGRSVLDVIVRIINDSVVRNRISNAPVDPPINSNALSQSNHSTHYDQPNNKHIVDEVTSSGMDEPITDEKMDLSAKTIIKVTQHLEDEKLNQIVSSDEMSRETTPDWHDLMSSFNITSVHGGWSEWEDWGQCSLPCNGGARKRFRSCDSPIPSNGGRPCIGSNQESGDCNSEPCQEPVWADWGVWSLCSTTCGPGLKSRERNCLSSSDTKGDCDGDSMDMAPCEIAPCKVPAPVRGRGNVIGKINGVEIELAVIDAQITPALTDDSGAVIMAEIATIHPDIGSDMRLLTSLVSSFYWVSAQEVDGAVNGFTLTEGNFQRDAQVEFATGEILTLTHLTRGVDPDGYLLTDVIVDGRLPDFPNSADITLEPYVEDYIQTGPGQIYGSSARLFRVDGQLLPFAWNHTLFYDDELYGRMPHLVERLIVKRPSSLYQKEISTLSLGMEAHIEPAEPADECPSGYLYDPTGPFCKDTDECSRLKPCSHICTNTAGGYRCSCPSGLTLNQDAKTCQDVDECSMGLARCHRSQDCLNTEGSYQCVARCEAGFKRTSDGLACVDINECTESEEPVCEQKCINVPGGYQCRCRFGFRLYGISRCIDINECDRTSPPCTHTCINTPGGYKCECPAGSRLMSSGTCDNIDECVERTHDCGSDEDCVDLPPSEGRYQCVTKCPAGMDKTEDGVCTDRDECSLGTHMCSYNQVCNNMNGTYTCTCRKGYRTDGPGNPCVDYDECRQPGLCQYQCRNTDGGFRCLCPPGFILHSSGRACVDRDECSELGIQCGPDQRCFNHRGGYQCVDVSCPVDYVRLDSGGCGLPCSKRPEMDCRGGLYVDVIEFHMLAIPSGIPALQDLLRLTAYNQNHEQLFDTDFTITYNDNDSFVIRVEDGRGIVSSLKRLQEMTTYRITVKSVSYERGLSTIQYQTTFIIYISVSQYPF